MVGRTSNQRVSNINCAMVHKRPGWKHAKLRQGPPLRWMLDSKDLVVRLELKLVKVKTCSKFKNVEAIVD